MMPGKNFKLKYFCLTVISIIFYIDSTAQKVVHQHYTTYYNAQKLEPDSVVWDLTPNMVTCTPPGRKDKFVPDPLLPNSVKPTAYQKSGYDKGHLFSYADAECDSADAIECFYMTNMLPQIHQFNAGDWATIEKYERQLAANSTLHILAGGIGSMGKTKTGVNIPANFWKAIYSNCQWLVWVIPNAKSSKGHTINYWQRTIPEINTLTGLKL